MLVRNIRITQVICRHFCKNLEMLRFVLPIDPPASASEIEKRIWEKKSDSYSKREEALEQTLQQLFSLVMGQCTENMRS